MKKNVLAAVTIFILLLAACATPAKEPTPTPIPTVELAFDVFPLSKGTYWLYEGKVEWQEDSTVKKDTVTCKMEVVDVIERENLTAYRMKGHPDDLAWYEPDRLPADYLIIKIGPKYYRADDLAIWDRLEDPDDALVELVNEGQIFLDLPLWEGKFFGETVQFARPDTFYRWMVENAQTGPLAVKGAPAKEEQIIYTLAYRSAPDHQLVEFAPGVGITRYVYSHHGTVSEVDAKLVEYYPGE